MSDDFRDDKEKKDDKETETQSAKDREKHCNSGCCGDNTCYSIDNILHLVRLLNINTIS